MIKKIIYILLITALASCGGNKEVEKGVSDINTKIQTVKVVNPFVKSFTSELKIIGNALPNKQVKIHAMEGGYLAVLKKDIGDKVLKGDVLALLQNPELTRLLEKDRVQKEVTESAYNRLKKVYKKTPALTTTQDLENTEAAYLMANAQYLATANRVSFLTVKAPFSGIISQRMVDEGALIQSGISSTNATPIFEIMDLETIRLTIALPETDIDNINVGMEAKIELTEIAGEPYVAKITRMANALDNDSKTMKVEIDIPNKEGKIKGGMFAQVSIQLKSSDYKLALPTECLIAVKSEYFLLLVKDKKVSRIPIKKGLSNTKYFEVMSNEVNEGSQVISEGKGLVKEGSIVNVVLGK
tara:strand:- start:1488 stop:2555 length:1068 start_codon:yes stop_codon:yes gene_type:complete